MHALKQKLNAHPQAMDQKSVTDVSDWIKTAFMKILLGDEGHGQDRKFNTTFTDLTADYILAHTNQANSPVYSLWPSVFPIGAR